MVIKRFDKLIPLTKKFAESASIVLGKDRDIAIFKHNDFISNKVIMRFKFRNNFGNWLTIDKNVTGYEDNIKYLTKIFGELLGEAAQFL